MTYNILIDDGDRKIFDNHIIKIVEPWDAKTCCGEYIFKRPDSGFYSIHIIFRPDTIIIYGDTRPNIILRQSGIDLPWLRGAVGDANYLFQKLTTGDLREYDQEATEKYALEMLTEQGYNKIRIQSMLEKVDFSNPIEAGEFLREGDDDATICESYQNCAVLVAGLTKFCEMVKDGL